MTNIASARMNNPKSAIRNPQSRPAFTLMELLIVMLIIAVLAALALTALQGAAEEARADRTRAIINKLDQLIMQRYNEYRTKPLPIRVPPGTPPNTAALYRLVAMRELMRMELPDRRSDVFDVTDLSYETVATANMTNAALQRTYYRKALVARGGSPTNLAPLAGWTIQHEGAECLYLIVSSMHDGDKNALDFFMPGEIGDVDDDGMNEILDGWRNPIEFLRWAPGYCQHAGPDGAWGVAGTDDDGDGLTDNATEAGWQGSDDATDPDTPRPVTKQSRNYAHFPDQFDPVKADPRWASTAALNKPFILYPLIFSAGRDKGYDVSTRIVDMDNNRDFRYSQTATYPPAGSRLPNDPYFIPPSSWTGQLPAGTLGDINGNGYFEWADNITNHFQPTNAQ